MNLTTRHALVLLLLALPMAGCGLFGRKSEYERSRTARPLEIPPDLDAPSTAGALVIPETAAGSPSGTATAAPSAAPSPAPGPIVAGDDATLKLGDAVAGAWKRVGLALERSAVGEIVSRDEATATYTVRSEVVERDGGFLSRMVGRDKVSTTTATRVVRIVADGEGSEVRIEDEAGQAVDDTAARRIIAALKQRLG